MGGLATRLLGGALTLLGVSTVTFTLLFVLPSDPARIVAGPKADPATVASIRHELGLDAPVAVQFARYLMRVSHGDLGRSYITRRTVVSAVLERVPFTLTLALASLGAAVGVGLLLGIVSSLRPAGRVDLAVLVASLLVLSVPTFWVGVLLLDVFAYRLRWLPLGGANSVASLVLPATALAASHAAYYGRLLHSSMREVLNEDYVRTARAKGLSRRATYTRHALRNALLPLTSVIGLDFAGLMGGVVLTETVFNWPGLGRLAVEAAFNQDIPVIMGTLQFSAAMVIATNLATDALYAVIDPRLRAG